MIPKHASGVSSSVDDLYAEFDRCKPVSKNYSMVSNHHVTELATNRFRTPNSACESSSLYRNSQTKTRTMREIVIDTETTGLDHTVTTPSIITLSRALAE
jgi:hypothetical protein